MSREEFLFVEGARTTLCDAMESVDENERALTTKMNEWAPYFASLMTPVGCLFLVEKYVH